MIDRFICRREGHQPTVTVTNTAGLTGSYVTNCKRCGKYLEIELTHNDRRAALVRLTAIETQPHDTDEAELLARLMRRQRGLFKLVQAE